MKPKDALYCQVAASACAECEGEEVHQSWCSQDGPVVRYEPVDFDTVLAYVRKYWSLLPVSLREQLLSDLKQQL